MNEFLYHILKDSGLTSRLDEEIGIEFTDLHKSSIRSTLVKSLVSYGSGEFEDQTAEELRSSDCRSQRSEALIRAKNEFKLSCEAERQ